MKIFSKLTYVILFSFLLTGCYKKYDRTITVCNGNLFVERYSHNSIDVAYYYLTDSTNFRIFIGKFDNEHGGYHFNCLNDSIEIFEVYEEKIVNSKKYSFVNLRKRKDFNFWNLKKYFEN